MDLTETEVAVARELARHFVDAKNSTLLVTACRCGHRVGLEEGWSEHIAVAVTAAATAERPLAAAA
ncbi:hypothetical protein [Sinomonas sp. RB5]